MPQAERIGVFVNRMAAPRYKAFAEKLAGKLHVTQHEVFPIPEISDAVKTIIAVGGDGTVRSLTQNAMGRETPIALVVVPGGSQNGLYHSLKHAGAVITMGQLQDNAIGHLPFFYPGSISREVFNHLTDVSGAGVLHASETEKLRGMVPRGLRAYAGAIRGLTTMKPSVTFFRYETKTFMLSPFVGPFKVFPGQNLYSDEITLMRITAESKGEAAAKLLTFLVYAFAGRQPPVSIAEFMTAKSFEVKSTYPTKMNADGEVISLPNERILYVTRHTKSLRVGALKL